MGKFSHLNDEQLRKVAQERVYVKRGYFYTLGAFIVLSGIMVGIYFLTGEGYPWFIWPIAVFGLFLLGHTFGTIRSLRMIDGKPGAVDREFKRLRAK